MTAFALKLIAIAAMTLDHLGAVIFTGSIALRAIGRLTMPIMSYLIAEGYRHTSNKTKYLCRLLVFAAISEIPFDMAFNNAVLEFSSQNVMLTLALGLCAIWLYDKNKHSILKYLYPFLMCFIAELLLTDYSSLGVALIFIFYLMPQNKPLYILLAVAGFSGFMCFNSLAAYGFRITQYSFGRILMPACAVFAAIPLMLYNKKRGCNIKYFFYAYYPLHLLIIAFAASGIIRH